MSRIFEYHLAAGMIRALRAVNTLQVAKFFERKDVIDLQRANDVVLAVRQGNGLADLERSGQALINRKADRNGPGVSLATFDNDFLIKYPIEGRLVHGPDERTQAAVAEAIEARKIGVADRHILEGGSFTTELDSFGQRHRAIHGFTPASMRRNKVRHKEYLRKKRTHQAAG